MSLNPKKMWDATRVRYDCEASLMGLRPSDLVILTAGRRIKLHSLWWIYHRGESKKCNSAELKS
jgi:hypothetical protein